MLFRVIITVLLINLAFEELQSSPVNRCPAKTSSGCTIVTAIQPRCSRNFVYPQQEYNVVLSIQTCLPRKLLRLYWFIRSNENVLPLNCRDKWECSVQDSVIRGRNFVVEARIFLFHSEQKPSRRFIIVPIYFTRVSLSAVLGLVDRQKIEIADLLKVMRHLSTSKAETSEESDIRGHLISKARVYLNRFSVINKRKGSSTKSPSQWIPIGKANTSAGVSKISMMAPWQTVLYGDAIRNNIKTLLVKENVTTTYLAKLTRIIQIMGKSIIQQQNANMLYDRSQFDSQLHNMTSKILTLLRKMNSTKHKIGSKLYTTEAHWSGWSIWSSCVKNCKTEYSTRSRTCFINEDTYKACRGHSSEVRKCPCIPKPTPPKPTGPTLVYGVWSSWGHWSQCSVTCGLGKEQRYRKCIAKQLEFRDANTIVKCKGSRQTSRACITAACGSNKAEYKILQGRTTTLTCKAHDGKVHKSMFWVSPRGKRYRPGRHGRISVTKKGQLDIKHARHRDGGTYYCIIPITNGNIIGSAEIMVLTCRDDPCRNGGTCIERKYEIISRPSSFVCECSSGYSGDFCEIVNIAKIKQMKALLIIIPVCAGVLMLTCLITVAAVRFKKKKLVTTTQNKTETRGEKNNLSSKEKSKKKYSVEKKSKHNKSVISGDDSLQEIDAKDIDQLMSPVKSRKLNVSYKRQSLKNSELRNNFVTDLQPQRRQYDEILTPANTRNPDVMYTRQQIVGNSEPRNTIIEANQGRSQIYPSTSDEIRKWYTSPQSNAEYHNPPMHVNVYENNPTIREENNTPFYANFPDTFNQTKNVNRPFTELKYDTGVYESMNPVSGSLRSTDMGDFKLIHKSLTPHRNTIRRYPNKDTPQDIPDEPISEERNMSNINLETEKYCHPTDICGSQSLKLNLRDTEHRSQEFCESDITENKDSEIFFHRFKRQSKTGNDPFDCVLDFDFSRNNASKIKEQNKSYVVQKMMDRSIMDCGSSAMSRKLSKRGDEIYRQEQQFTQHKDNLPTPPLQILQLPQSQLQNKIPSPDTQMQNVVHDVNAYPKIASRNQRNCSSSKEQNVKENDDNVGYREEVFKNEEALEKSEDTADIDASITKNNSFNQENYATQDISDDTMMRNLSQAAEYDEEVTFNQQKSTKSLTEASSDDDIVYHRKYLKKRIKSNVKNDDDNTAKLTDSSVEEETRQRE